MNETNLLQTTIPQIIHGGYLVAFISAIVAILLIWVVANSVAYKPHDKSYIKRRVWYFIILIIASVATFGYSLYQKHELSNSLSNNTQLTDVQGDLLMQGTWKALAITIVSYLLITILLMIAKKKSKFGSIFFPKK